MGSFRIEHTFNCSEKTFWDQVFFDNEYNRRQFSEALRFSLWKELSREDRGADIYRVVQAAPPVDDLPGPLKAVIGDSAGYEERGTYVKATNHYTAKVVPNKLADKLTIEVKMWTQAKGDGACLRVAEATVVAKIFGIGGMLEKKMLADMEKSYVKSAAFTNQWLAEKKLAGT
jgi:hypothetical protein